MMTPSNLTAVWTPDTPFLRWKKTRNTEMEVIRGAWAARNGLNRAEGSGRR